MCNFRFKINCSIVTKDIEDLTKHSKYYASGYDFIYWCYFFISYLYFKHGTFINSDIL